MTERPVDTKSASRFRLRTFGALSLAGVGDDMLLGKHGHQRRRLALLAVLAAAGDAGRTRDQLLLLFWPDATQARARHSLEQLLYAIRTSVDENVFDGGNPVRLNTRVVNSDVQEFRSALARGDLEAAVEEYRGPFLDGFYLSDAPEFEQWLETERARLAQSHLTALERLAQNAKSTGDHAAAVKWWRKLSEADPVSSRHATGLMQALAHAGDHAAALQYAEQYESVVARELGTKPGQSVVELAAKIREESQSEPTGVRPRESEAPTSSPVVVAVAEDSVSQPIGIDSSRSSYRWVFAAIAVVAAAGLIAAAWMRFSQRNVIAPGAVERSIAVLPFTNVNAIPDDRAFVDGLTEELIAELARLPGLHVTARTSAFVFRNSRNGAREIADSLGVANLLEGSVQRSGQNLRVQVRLIDPAQGTTRWSETYDRELKDVFAVQSEIASAVARELDLRLRDSIVVQAQHLTTTNVAAYEAYLRGNDPASTRSDSAARAALAYFSRAIELDSQYAAAYAGLSRMHMRLRSGSDSSMKRSERLDLALRAAQKAIALDNNLADGHASLAFIFRTRLAFKQYVTELERAVALEPADGRLREWLAQAYMVVHRRSDALKQARRALELDPLSPTAAAEVAHALILNGQCDAALPYLARLRMLRPPLLRVTTMTVRCFLRQKKWDEAVAELKLTEANAGTSGRGLLGFAHARAGRTAEARRILRMIIDQVRRNGAGASDVAVVYTGLGESDSAFAWLDTAIARNELGLNYDLVLEEFAADQRGEVFLNRLGIQNR